MMDEYDNGFRGQARKFSAKYSATLVHVVVAFTTDALPQG